MPFYGHDWLLQDQNMYLSFLIVVPHQNRPSKTQEITFKNCSYPFRGRGPLIGWWPSMAEPRPRSVLKLSSEFVK